tara:strand:+ start:639 stop:899 length:261 start_codon:yes stop_codon:yes gene_type:complete
MLTKRLEILFDPKEFEAIRKKAKSEDKSVARLIREAVKEKIIDKDKKRKDLALKRLFSPEMETSFGKWTEEKKKIIKGRIKEIEAH